MAGTITHSWNGSILTITSDSGTSSMDLKGPEGQRGIRGPQGATGFTIGADGTIDTSNFATTDYVNYAVSTMGGSGGGISETAKTLLINILRNCVYTGDISSSIDALAAALSTPNSGDDSQGITILQVGNTLSISGVDNVSEITQTGTLLILE